MTETENLTTSADYSSEFSVEKDSILLEEWIEGGGGDSKECKGTQLLPLNKNQVLKCFELFVAFKRDPSAADFRVSLLVRAMREVKTSKNAFYNFPTTLSPQNLILLSERIPNPWLILHSLSTSRFDCLEGDVIDLLHWVLVNKKASRVVKLQETLFKNIAQKVSNKEITQQPRFIFKVMNYNKSKGERKWSKIKKSPIGKFAYFKTDVENYHALLSSGFGGYYDRELLLTNDLDYLLRTHKEEPNKRWNKSKILRENSVIIAVIEFVDSIMVATKADDFSEQQKSDRYPTFYHIHDPQALRLRYLFVFENCNPKPTPIPSRFPSRPQYVHEIILPIFIIVASLYGLAKLKPRIKKILGGIF